MLCLFRKHQMNGLVLLKLTCSALIPIYILFTWDIQYSGIIITSYRNCICYRARNLHKPSTQSWISEPPPLGIFKWLGAKSLMLNSSSLIATWMTPISKSTGSDGSYSCCDICSQFRADSPGVWLFHLLTLSDFNSIPKQGRLWNPLCLLVTDVH